MNALPKLVPPPFEVDKPSYRFGNARCHLAPYVADNGAYSKDFLVRLYEKTRDQGLLKIAWSGMGIDQENFVAYLQRRPVVVGFIRSQANFEVAGFGFLSEIEGEEGYRKASLGFAFFRPYRKTHAQEIRDLADFALDWWFSVVKVDVLYGTMMRKNFAALAFSKEMGFVEIGILPGFFCKAGDARLVVLTRADFKHYRFGRM